MELQKLVRAARSGDKGAVGKIYDTFLDAVYRFVFFRVGTREDAEDITEAVFISIFEHIRDYKEKGLPFEAWIYRIARNKIIDHYRTHKPRVSLEEITEKPSDESVENKVLTKLTKEYVMNFLRTLPESYQEIIILKYIEEKTNEEISELLDKPLAHVRVLQSRAIGKLRSVVGEK